MPLIPQYFLSTWNTYGLYAALASIAIGLGVFLWYEVRLLMLPEYKQRYDFVSIHEVQYIWRSGIFALAGIFLLLNTLVGESSWTAFSVRLVISAAILGALIMLMQYILKFHYPFYVERRLKALRYSPRISPDGRKMKLLTEEEEDVFLDEGMQAEEDAYSVDYDVWVDEVSGFIRVERYYGRLHAEKCNECHYLTMRFQREEIVKYPTATNKGTLVKYFHCSYCGYEKTEECNLARTAKQEEYAAQARGSTE